MASHEMPDNAVGHERDRVPVGAIAKFGLALVVLMIATLSGLALLFRVWTARESALPLLPGLSHKQELPRPRLQTSPRMDLEQLRQSENRVLNGYGWVDRDAGTVRIPIDRAMELLVQRGPPFRKVASGATPSGKGATRK
jgi:hypothetical protein